MKVKREEVKHWLGNSYKDWIEDLMFRLMNNKVSIEEIKEEAKLMYKDYNNKKLINEDRKEAYLFAFKNFIDKNEKHKIKSENN